MKSRQKSTVISSKQKRLLFRVAEGASLTQAAHETGYHRTWASELMQTESFRREIAALQEQASAELARRLPSLVTDALTVLEDVLKSRAFYASDRIRAAGIVCALAEKCLSRVPAPDESVIDLARDEAP